MTLANLSIYYTWKNNKSEYSNKINLKFLLQLRMTSLIYLMDHILFQTFKIILSILLKRP